MPREKFEKDYTDDQALQDDKASKKANAKKLKMEKKEEKRLKKEMEAELDEEDVRGSKLTVFIVTLLIIIVWLAIFAFFIKSDVGGFGSTIFRPILKDIPVINQILPAGTASDYVEDPNYPYVAVEDAVDQIKALEIELQSAQTENAELSNTIADLTAEIEKLQTFEDNQVEFEKLKSEFYNEVVFTENAPDLNEYKTYYESIDPSNAELLYKQVVEQIEYSSEVTEYAKAYGEMKPAQAAAILETMTNDMELAASILENINAKARGEILGAMDPTIAAKLTKVMAP